MSTCKHKIMKIFLYNKHVQICICVHKESQKSNITEKELSQLLCCKISVMSKR